jgi:UDP-hydrolysing UDP-N-acetyl-D-glucosamine 2-epimerase
MKTIGAVTSARSDYGIYRPVFRQIEQTDGLQLVLYVTGMHLSPQFGLSVREIENDGFEIAARVEMHPDGDSPQAISDSIGRGTQGFANVFSDQPPDILMVLGDRYEMLPAAIAAMPFNIPVAHIHGGESTEGVIDEPIRHSMTKMSHLHFPSTQAYADRIVRMGEEPWRVTVSGAPSLDNLHEVEILDHARLKSRYGIDICDETLLVTFHPVTLEYRDTLSHIQGLLAALQAVDRPCLFTLPNADTSGATIIEEIQRFVTSRESAQQVDNLGTQGYFSVMSHVSAMVGNSSSGIIEAPSFELPVVNIGRRQRNRITGQNVIHCGYDPESIQSAIERATSSTFRQSLRGSDNPYGTGNASEIITRQLLAAPLGSKLIIKSFFDG